MKKIYLFALLLALASSSQAQCSMCKANAEASDAKGLNVGILYLLTLPYLMIGGISYVWWRNRIQLENSEQETEILKLLEPEEKKG